jgi:tripeptidyl-peptidase-1
MFKQHSYQVAAVAKYLTVASAAGLPPAGSFDRKGRATPDVAALGEGYQVVVGGVPTAVGGTSASSPCFAGLVSLLNEARKVAGKPPMGFLNPFLYQNAAAFTDVTQGTNKLDRAGTKLQYGWDAAPGWDPVTGLGTPLFPKLMAAAMATGVGGVAEA